MFLDFNDSECTTICPLTTTAMRDAQRMLGPAGDQVQLLGIDANPKATSIADVLSYSQLHGMLGQWHFLTGSLPQLRRVWRDYHVQAAIERGLIEHTPALYVIDPQGRLRRLYVTQQSYSAVGQFGQLLAQEAARLLPGHPRVDANASYAQVPTITPAQTGTLPKAGGGTLAIGPGRDAPVPVLRHVGPGGDEPRWATRGTQRLRDRRATHAAPCADRGRRGHRRALRERTHIAPARPRPPADVSRRHRHQRTGR